MKNILLRTFAIRGSSGTRRCMFGEKGSHILVFSHLLNQRVAPLTLSNVVFRSYSVVRLLDKYINFPVEKKFPYFKNLLILLL